MLSLTDDSGTATPASTLKSVNAVILDQPGDVPTLNVSANDAADVSVITQRGTVGSGVCSASAGDGKSARMAGMDESAKKTVHQDVATVSLDLTTRAYADSDWEAVCRVYGPPRPIELAGSPVLTERGQASSLGEVAEEEGFFKSRTVVALADARVIGFASVEVACLRFFYIDPDFHRRGLGRALFARVKPLMGDEGYTYVVATNAPAIAFYWSAGMEVACRFPGEAEGMACECVRLAFPTSSHRRRPGRPTSVALRLEADRLGVSVDTLQREWLAEP